MILACQFSVVFISVLPDAGLFLVMFLNLCNLTPEYGIP